MKAVGPAEAAKLVTRRIRKRLHVVPRVPPIVFIEITNRCNLNCIMCDRSSMKRKSEFMDMGLFRRIIDNAARIGVPDVKLNRFGEPLLHPNLLEMVEYARNKPFSKVYFTSNALLLDEHKSRALIQAGLDAITFSIDGATKETYEKIRRGGSYEKAVNNVLRFHAIRKELGSRTPITSLNTILMKETEEEIFDVLDKWEPVFDVVNLIPVGTYGNIESRSTVEQSGCDFETIPCHHIFDRLMVFTNGDATVCCGDIDGVLSVGNLREQTIEELWKGEKFNRIRRLHLKRDFREIPVCTGCDGINKDKFEKMQKAVQTVLANRERRTGEN